MKQPRIMREKIELKIMQQISSFAKTETSGINSPTLTKREVVTTITMNDGEILVIGGMNEDKELHSKKGLRLLPEILRGKQTEKTKTQILILLQVNRTDHMQELSAKEEA